MRNNRKITISTAGSRKSINWQPQSINISELFEKLKTPLRGKETLSVYMGMKKAQQDDLKDVGGFVGGSLTGRRKKSNVKNRDVLTLDLDNCPPGGTAEILRRIGSLGMCFCVYSTRKHNPAAPRLRVIVPTDRTMTTDEYEPIARKLAELIQPEMHWFDPTTFQAERLMYWPSCCVDSEFVYEAADKPLLSADGMLKLYTDWHDVKLWPQVPGEQKIREKAVSKQGDPTEKKGVIGAFCRIYNVFQAMDKFIPGVYLQTEQEDRYTYSGGSTTGGAIIYEDGKFLYSHHATDPCGGQLVNAFDMVRLHLFGELDEDAKADTPTNRLPSYVKMTAFAYEADGVRKLMDEERRRSALLDFGDLENDEAWHEKLARDKNQIAQTILNCRIILRCDPELRKRFGRDEFSQHNKVLDSLPWNSDSKLRHWTDTDDAGLYEYMEKNYGLTSRLKIDSAWKLANEDFKFHPVKDYLNSCTWDGVPRVETYFIDYLGAEDTPYVRAVTRKTLCAAVARAFVPGIKFDYMLTLAGKQGIGKSTAIKKLAGDWFSDTLSSMTGKEAYEQIQGYWIIEIAELTALRRSDIEQAKNFISKQSDYFREAYARRATDHPRQCIFIGTTNRSEFLLDTTGNRRYWPVDVDASRATKKLSDITDEEIKQIWGEAVELWKNGEKLYLPPELEAAAAEEQENHRATADAESIVLNYLDMLVPENWEELSLDSRRMFINGRLDGAKGVKHMSVVCVKAVREEAFKAAGFDDKFITPQDINAYIEAHGGYVRLKKLKRIPVYGVQRCFSRLYI